MTVPFIFANASGRVPASELDVNFAYVSNNVSTANIVVFAAQPNITSVGNLTSLVVDGSVTSSQYIGNGNALTDITGGNVVGAVAYATTANSVDGGNVSGPVAYATTANSVAGANVFGAVGLATVADTANAVAGANVSGQVGNALIAGTVYTHAQPNITSVGILSNVSVTGNVRARDFYGISINSDTANLLVSANVADPALNWTFINDYSATGVASLLGPVAGYNQRGEVLLPGRFSTGTVTFTGPDYASFPDSLVLAAGANISIAQTPGGLGNAATYVTTFDTSGDWYMPGNVSATGNVDGNYFTGNGRQLTGILATSSYDNANVTALLSNLGGNVISGTGNITTTANILGNYILGNGSQLTGLSAHGNADVVAYGESGWAGNIIPSGNAVYSLGNSTNQWADLWVSNATIYIDSVPLTLGAGNVLTVNGQALLSNDSDTTIATTGNITANTFILTNGVTLSGAAGNTIALGAGTGVGVQGLNTVAIGTSAGVYQGYNAVAIGLNAGNDNQGISTIAIGQNAGSVDQDFSAIAIGVGAGNTTQGRYSIAIGRTAGQTNQANNSIILNATGAVLNQTTANTFTVAPVRNDVANTAQVMFYNTTSKEVTYGNVISVAGNIDGGNIRTGGLVSVTGNVRGGNLLTAGLVTAAGNVTAGNVLTGGTISATGNVRGGNINTGGDVNATGNIIGNNITPSTPSVTATDYELFSGGSYTQNPGSDGCFTGIVITAQKANIYNVRSSPATVTGMNYTSNSAPFGNTTISSITWNGNNNPVVGNLSAGTYKFYVTNGGNISPGSDTVIVNYLSPRLPSVPTQASGLFLTVPTYTASNLVITTGSTGQLACVSDSPTYGGKLAYWNPTNNIWRYVADDSSV